jgi:Holliday junction resolvasome RuvABC endonuclease subunit
MVVEKNIILIGADFSIAKPALCCYYNKELKFSVFPQKIDSKTETVLRDNGVYVINRNLEPICTTDKNHIYNQISRYRDLANTIVNYIKSFDAEEYIFSSEGLSFASHGNMTMELASAKAILLSTLIDNNINQIYTYSPITLKSTAGCGQRGENKKENMINKFREEPPMCEFMEQFKNNDGIFKKKTNYMPTIDDLADSYWCLKTLIKENYELLQLL